MLKKAVVILSGGQDSATCLYWALKNAEQVYAIHFAYGQKHSVEKECAENICEKEGVPFISVDLDFMKVVTDSELIKQDGDVNKLNEKGLPSSFVPNRNQIFITIAHSWAQKLGAEALVTGVCQTDYSGYPDCREEFIIELQKTLNYGSQSSISIYTPLMYLTKAQTFALAEELGVLKEIIELTHTCYNGDRNHLNEWGYGCGHCPACQLRKKGYYDFSSR